ncbi:hypothetical protein [Methylobacterium sp. WSM2598]|uniref:hypothetical protein n=1 Tax=Methylobacterium sp. WSM2598 TaxID=398261 RepID=UPI00037B721E|nr:hypothetical protein [Methylobacterium sp. WSM2598]
MANQQFPEGDEEPSAEDRAMQAEVAYGLLEQTLLRLALAYETAVPGGFALVNRELMRGVVADLTELQQPLPDGVTPGVAFTQVATMLRETLLDAEAQVCTPKTGGH